METLFTSPVPEQIDGIYRTLRQRPRVPVGQASNFLPLTAALYEPLWRPRSIGLLSGGTFSTERELALMLEQVAPSPGSTILDAACSAGLYARTLLAHDPSLTLHAVDYSLPFLKKARAYARRDNLSLNLVHADVAALPYQEQVFDAIVCGGSLNEFLEVPTILAEFARTLKPGGQMWQMYISQAEDLPGRTLQALIRTSGIRFIDPTRLEQQAQEVGLRLVRAQYRGRIAMALFAKV